MCVCVVKLCTRLHACVLLTVRGLVCERSHHPVLRPTWVLRGLGAAVCTAGVFAGQCWGLPKVCWGDAVLGTLIDLAGLHVLGVCPSWGGATAMSCVLHGLGKRVILACTDLVVSQHSCSCIPCSCFHFLSLCRVLEGFSFVELQGVVSHGVDCL